MKARRGLAALALCLAAGCGGAPAPPAGGPPAAPAAGGAPSEAEACFAAANATRAPVPNEPAKVGLKHVLVKFAGAKSADASVTRTREQACLRAMEARDKIRGGADFEAVVKEYSEEAGAATRGGSLGSLERKELAKPVADAAFELSVSQLSDVVESEYGFHLVFRTE